VAETVRGGPVRDRIEDLGGAEPEGFTPTLSFGYAAQARPGVAPRYMENWTSPTWPALIEVSIGARFEEMPGRSFELKTAVIPGMLPPRPLVPLVSDLPSTPSEGTP
jgi:hypothetical protein